jgi:hypothetical protein
MTDLLPTDSSGTRQCVVAASEVSVARSWRSTVCSRAAEFAASPLLVRQPPLSTVATPFTEPWARQRAHS